MLRLPFFAYRLPRPTRGSGKPNSAKVLVKLSFKQGTNAKHRSRPGSDKVRSPSENIAECHLRHILRVIWVLAFDALIHFHIFSKIRSKVSYFEPHCCAFQKRGFLIQFCLKHSRNVFFMHNTQKCENVAQKGGVIKIPDILPIAEPKKIPL